MLIPNIDFFKNDPWPVSSDGQTLVFHEGTFLDYLSPALVVHWHNLAGDQAIHMFPDLIAHFLLPMLV